MVAYDREGVSRRQLDFGTLGVAVGSSTYTLVFALPDRHTDRKLFHFLVSILYC